MRSTPDCAEVTLSDGSTLQARLAVVADGTGAAVAGVRRTRRDYGQAAVVAKVATRRPHGGRRLRALHAARPDGAAARGRALRARLDRCRREEAERALALPDAAFLAELAQHFGSRRDDFVAVEQRRSFPLALEFAQPTVTHRCVLVGNAAQALHPIAGQGFNLGLRDAFELSQIVNTAAPQLLGTHEFVARYAARRGADRRAGIAFTDGLARIFAIDNALVRWPRGIGLALLDAVPPVKRAFTRAMLFGL